MQHKANRSVAHGPRPSINPVKTNKGVKKKSYHNDDI